MGEIKDAHDTRFFRNDEVLAANGKVDRKGESKEAIELETRFMDSMTAIKVL